MCQIWNVRDFGIMRIWYEEVLVLGKFGMKRFWCEENLVK